MKVQELVDLINAEADELLDNDEDNIPYVNHAIDLLSFFLAANGDPELIATKNISDGENVPSTFLNFIPRNGYPVYIDAGKFKIFTDDSTLYNVRYAVGKEHVSSLVDEIPFKEMFTGAMVLICSYLIKKKTYIPVEYCQQDKSFISELMQAIQSAKGVV